jgi:hypothetical protein
MQEQAICTQSVKEMYMSESTAQRLESNDRNLKSLSLTHIDSRLSTLLSKNTHLEELTVELVRDTIVFVNDVLKAANVQVLTLRRVGYLDDLNEGLAKTTIPRLILAGEPPSNNGTLKLYGWRGGASNTTNTLGVASATALGNNTSVRDLVLNLCEGVDSVTFSLLLKNQKLHSLKMKQVKSLASVDLSFISNHPSLREVDIGFNKLTDNAVAVLLNNFKLRYINMPMSEVSDEMKKTLKHHTEQNIITQRQLFIEQMLAVLVKKKESTIFATIPTDILKLIFHFLAKDLCVPPDVKEAVINLVCANITNRNQEGKREWQKQITLGDKSHTVFRAWAKEGEYSQVRARYEVEIAKENKLTLGS